MGCSPLTQKTGWSTVNGTRQILKGNFHGDALVLLIATTFSRKIGSEAIQAKRPGTTKTSKGNAHFPFGYSVWEFWSTFQEIPFSREDFRSGRQNLSFHLHSIRNFRIFWVNGKQP